MSEIVDSIPLTPREAASGILGSISLACWVFLLVPQLIENYRNGNAQAISFAFILVWFLGDIANLVGALWAGLVPVVVAIAIYFCIADGVLICQYLYYKGKASRREISGLHGGSVNDDGEDAVHQPTTPLLGRRMSEDFGILGQSRSDGQSNHDPLIVMLEEEGPKSAWAKNTLSFLGICLTGIAGWTIAWKTGVWLPTPIHSGGNPAEVAIGARIVGYISALCYLGARIPQIMKNHREKSCVGLSLLFFVLSLLGNATYGAGILFHSTEREYVLTNLPWLIGSLGTIVEDVVIFAQFRIYAPNEGPHTTVV